MDRRSPRELPFCHISCSSTIARCRGQLPGGSPREESKTHQGIFVNRKCCKNRNNLVDGSTAAGFPSLAEGEHGPADLNPGKGKVARQIVLESTGLKTAPTFFQRILLPGFAFKAVVIGGGYATGRELVEFFFPAGPVGGLLGLSVTMALWSLACVATFLFALATQSFDYRSFFQRLLGPFWVLFEAAYVALIMLVLSVFAASAGEICALLFGWPSIAGTLLLMLGIAAVLAFGNSGVELLFRYVTVFLYIVYVLFFLLSMNRFGAQLLDKAHAPIEGMAWLSGGISYAGYNLVGAVVILPMVRHLRSPRDAIVAGLLCGPLAAVPAILFFISLAAFYPQVGNAIIPSDFLLERIDAPGLRLAFQAMVLMALLESGGGLIHAINERVCRAVGPMRPERSKWLRFAVAVLVMVVAVFVAQGVGLLTLIARGYRMSAIFFLCIYVVPLFTLGSYRLWKMRASATENSSGQLLER